MIRIKFLLPSQAKGEAWYQEWFQESELPEDWFEKWEKFRDDKKDGDELDPKVWGRLKGYLFALFRKKCAYCESHVQHVYSGEVDHYRPKSAVKEDPSHGGYGWLAYEMENFLPSCKPCNAGKGKQTQFPVIEGTRAQTPRQVAREKPLLLNPCDDDPDRSPERHLSFRVVLNGKDLPGMVEGITPEGRATVGICNLNRGLLVERRHRAQKDAQRELFVRLANADGPDGVLSARKEVCAEWLEYAVARQHAVEYWLQITMSKAG